MVLSIWILGFIPFEITMVDAIFPEKQQYIIDLNGKPKMICKNSWIRHFSLSYNERYNLVMRMLWCAYSFFATIALSIALMKGL